MKIKPTDVDPTGGADDQVLGIVAGVPTWIDQSGGGGGGGGGSILGGCLVYRSTIQNSVSGHSAGAAAIPFDSTHATEMYDTHNIHDMATNPSRLTVPAGVTKVRILGNVFLGAVNSGAIIILNIAKNGTASFPGQPYMRSAISNTDPGGGINSGIVDVVPGDYFELGLQTTGDSSITIRERATWFAMEIVEFSTPGGGSFVPVPPVIGDWSIATNTGGGATALNGLGGVALEATMTISGTSHQGKFFGVPITTGVPFTVTARLAVPSVANDFALAGVAIQESGSSVRTALVGSFQESSTAGGRSTTHYSFSDMSSNTAVAARIVRVEPPQYFRIEYNGTDLQGYASFDGIVWWPVGAPVTAALVFPGTINAAGIQLYGTAMTTGNVIAVVCDSFEVTY